ncbi:phage protease [Flavilitoribacter nigricans]|uniref:Peptidase n=1 Tax=Flavilitoribacter nigricans (strain ATCC 23147 / DSM 23189 / NBRC 102662 / NCIMB 1420 / SS-2) TaxID=1122177 RepID=A0A2D0MYS2_FLAN2|nr:phage protease [Flavilitoribacter nigricans]PHN00603.1 hypothetical protein CRP01_41355 [Flavilitoribacter nigricans DSM 23189 = NBRC 102662]
MPPITVVLSDESLNRHGYRVLTNGIDIKDFKKNPVMLYNHHRSVRHNHPKDILPIGKWSNIRKENGQLLADAEFDEDDEFAQKVAKKFEKGILNTASIGFDFVAISEDPKMMIPGQIRPTVTKSVLLEASIADIPSNPNCHKLSFQGKTLMLSADTAPDELDNILPILSNSQKENKMDITKMVAAALGMPEDVNETQIVAKATELSNQVAKLTADNKTLGDRLAALEQQSTNDKVETLVSAALTAGKITEAQKPHFLKLAAENFDATKDALESMQAYKPITQQLDNKDGDQLSLVERYDELDKAGKLNTLPDEELNLLLDAKMAHLRKSGKAKVTA